MADSPAATGDQIQQPKKITFRFCRECANLLYPKEDKANQKLEFACRTCYYSETAETTCIFRNELANTVGETAGITQDIGEDPTVGDDDSSDPNADFYAQRSPSADLISHFAPPPNHTVPDFCTMCGQEIFCEFCGQPSDRGFILEADEEQAGQLNGMMTPNSMTASLTPDLEASQHQLQELRLQQDSGGGRKDSTS